MKPDPNELKSSWKLSAGCERSWFLQVTVKENPKLSESFCKDYKSDISDIFVQKWHLGILKVSAKN